MRAALLLIGNELLSGKVAEANLRPLAHVLRARGVGLQRVVTIADDLAAIEQEVRVLRASYDLLFTSGGIGPTHDDVTMLGVARAFDTETVEHPLLAAVIGKKYGTRCTREHLRMALVPNGAELETTRGTLARDARDARDASDDLTIPHFEWPAVRIERTWILPGIPEAFRMKLEIVAAALARDPMRAPFVSRAVYTSVEETALVPLIDAVVQAFPDVEVGSYPKWFDESYRTKVTFDGRAYARIVEAANWFGRSLPAGSMIREE
jgi:molybdopterin-biosynthesis enzyme MoeA-like protein